MQIITHLVLGFVHRIHHQKLTWFWVLCAKCRSELTWFWGLCGEHGDCACTVVPWSAALSSPLLTSPQSSFPSFCTQWSSHQGHPPTRLHKTEIMVIHMTIKTHLLLLVLCCPDPPPPPHQVIHNKKLWCYNVRLWKPSCSTCTWDLPVQLPPSPFHSTHRVTHNRNDVSCHTGLHALCRVLLVKEIHRVCHKGINS